MSTFFLATISSSSRQSGIDAFMRCILTRICMWTCAADNGWRLSAHVPPLAQSAHGSPVNLSAVADWLADNVFDELEPAGVSNSAIAILLDPFLLLECLAVA